MSGAKGCVVFVLVVLVGCAGNTAHIAQDDWVNLNASALPRYVESIGYGGLEVSSGNAMVFDELDFARWRIRFGDKAPVAEYTCGDTIDGATCITIRNLVCETWSSHYGSTMNCSMGLFYLPKSHEKKVCDIYSWERKMVRKIKCPDSLKFIGNVSKKN